MSHLSSLIQLISEVDKESQELDNFIDEKHNKVFIKTYLSRIKQALLFLFILLPSLIAFHIYIDGIDDPEVYGFVSITGTALVGFFFLLIGFHYYPQYYQYMFAGIIFI